MEREQRKHAEHHLREWLESRLSRDARDTLVAVPIKLGLGVVLTAVLAVICLFAPLILFGPRRRYGLGRSDGAMERVDFLWQTGLVLAVAVPVAAFVIQAFVHLREHPVIRLRSGRVRYEDHLLYTKDDGGSYLKYAMLPAWMTYAGLEELMSATRLKAAPVRDCATILMLLMQTGQRIPAGEIEDMLPDMNVARALRALVRMEGVVVDRNRAHAVDLSNDLRAELAKVVYG